MGAWFFNAFARYVQRPALALVAHQPTMRGVFEVQAALTYRRMRDVTRVRARYGGVDGLEIRPHGVIGPPSLLYLHGGGFTIGSARTHQWLVARIAHGAGRVAFVPDYRLAPKHPFPAAVDDAEAAFEALSAEGPVCVAGDSAGGCLALGLCGTHKPESAALLSPVVDLSGDTKSETSADFSREMLLPRRWITRALRLYLDGADAQDPRASPIKHDLSNAPPMLIQCAGGEMLEAHARRLAEVVPHARLSVTENVAHVWQLNAGWMPEADAAVAEIAAFLRAPPRPT